MHAYRGTVEGVTEWITTKSRLRSAGLWRQDGVTCQRQCSGIYLRPQLESHQ
jgi:hypothetical protein